MPLPELSRGARTLTSCHRPVEMQLLRKKATLSQALMFALAVFPHSILLQLWTWFLYVGSSY